MITDRRRIANKLARIKGFILNAPAKGKTVEDYRADYAAAADVDRLRIAAKFDPEWKWMGFESEVEWARWYIGGVS